jgi:hypothetical protein
MIQEKQMSGPLLDLKNLIILIKQEKDLEANLILDEGCQLTVSDPKPLIKILNYVINYLNQVSDKALEIGLDLRDQEYLLNMMAFSTIDELPPVSDNLKEALQEFNAAYEVKHEKGSYIQFIIKIQR